MFVRLSVVEALTIAIPDVKKLSKEYSQRFTVPENPGRVSVALPPGQTEISPPETAVVGAPFTFTVRVKTTSENT